LLDAYLRRDRTLACSVNELGAVTAGSVVPRASVCGRLGCRRQADPSGSHGPDDRRTRKVRQREHVVRAAEAGVQRSGEWLDNARRLHQTVGHRHHVSAAAIQAILLP
jgi:hypothetical protein